MSTAVYFITAGLSLAINGIYWYRKGHKEGDALAMQSVTEMVEQKRSYDVPLSQAGDFTAWMLEQGMPPEYPLLVLGTDKYLWDGKYEI